MISVGGAATFSGAVTLGVETTDTVTITGTTTPTGVAVFNGAVTLGDASTDINTVNGVTTVNDGRCVRAGRVRLERCAEGSFRHEVVSC